LAELDCSKCKDARVTNGCHGKEWYKPGEIRYCKPQVIFILEYLRLMELGQYPRNPKETGYTELKVWVQRGKKDGYFVTPATIFSDIDARLKTAGKDGGLLRARYCDGYDEDALIKQYRMPYEELLARIDSALFFICGFYTKTNYLEWKKKRTYRANVHQKVGHKNQKW